MIAAQQPDLVYTRDILCGYRFVQAEIPTLYEVHDLESKHPSQNKTEGMKRRLETMDERTLRGA